MDFKEIGWDDLDWFHLASDIPLHFSKLFSFTQIGHGKLFDALLYISPLSHFCFNQK